MSGLTEGIEAWYTYNSRILRFAQTHPEHSIMCHIDGALRAIDTLVELCASRLGVRLALSQAEADTVYQPDELQHIQPSAETIAELGAVHADAARLYSVLQQNAALAGPLEPWWNVLSTPTLHPAIARARLLALCATIAPDATEAFFAHGDHDIPALQHHVHAAYAHAARMEHEARRAQSALIATQLPVAKYGSAPDTETINAPHQHMAVAAGVPETQNTADMVALRQAQSQMQFFKQSFQEAETYARSLETAFCRGRNLCSVRWKQNCADVMNRTGRV